ncbi:MAG TPA: hypothetical protein VK196_17060 [Magnetospirillum sp.]|nr:hypothetical protein [Magnetospirillum sp.]
MLQRFLTWYCEFFGYASCAAASTFEALVLFGLLALCLYIVLLVFFGVLAVVTAR